MLTEFGKELRKIRIDHAELLKDMAFKLNVSAAYLSAVERGKRSIPTKWIDIISKEYNLKDCEKKELQEKAAISKKTIKIDLDNLKNSQRDLALTFAREFKSLNNDEVKKIQSILSSRQNKQEG